MFKSYNLKLVMLYIAVFILFVCFLLSAPIIVPLIKGTWLQPLYTCGLPVITLLLTNSVIDKGYSIINKSSNGGEARKVNNKID